jgi:hypothetical protein
MTAHDGMLRVRHAGAVRIITTLVAVGAFFALAATASAWNSNSWQNPSRNIVCRYWYSVSHAFPTEVACKRRGAHFELVLRQTGVGWRQDYTDFRVSYYAPVLGYGQTWRSGRGLRCTSTREPAMVCKNTRGHGFALTRSYWVSW